MAIKNEKKEKRERERERERERVMKESISSVFAIEIY